MFRKLSTQIATLANPNATSSGPTNTHRSTVRASEYTTLADRLEAANIPVDHSDCAVCDEPCPPGLEQGGGGTVVEGGQLAWDGKGYEAYVEEKYGADLGELPKGFDTDWDSQLAGSGQPLRGRLVVVSTGMSDWTHNHLDEKSTFSGKLDTYITSAAPPPANGGGGGKKKTDFKSLPPVSEFTSPSIPISSIALPPPSIYSSSLISQSDDPDDQSLLVFPDWKVVNEVENSSDGAKGAWEGSLRGGLGRSGAVLGETEGVGRRRSWVLPYRAVILLCTHKRRDKRCHIAGPLLRSALETCLAAHDITIDSTGQSLSHLDGPPLEEISGTEEEREAEVEKRLRGIEGVEGGEGGEVGIFNINHLGGHRYAGVMLVLFPSGAYLSYGRLTPQEIPRVVEETILQGKVVPGLLRAGTGLERKEGCKGKGILGW